MKQLLLLLSVLFVVSCSSSAEEEPAPVIKYTLTTSANPTAGGTVAPTTGQYTEGATVSITATPAGEYLFSSWTGATGTTATTSVVMNSNKTVTANFVKKQYPLTIEIEGEGTVSEKVIKAGLATDYNSGTIVELTAEPTGDWEFVEWSGDITSTENPVQITIDQAKTVKARFIEPINYLVNSHYYKNEMNPYFDLIKITKNHGIEGPKYGGYDTGVAYADFNGDGYIDINLLLNPGVDGDYCEHFMLLNNGDDTFTMKNDLITNTSFNTYMSRKTIVGDFNGDKIADVVRIAGGHDWLRKSNILISENGSFTFKELEGVPESQYHGFASGDLDNDGDLDLFFGSPNSGFAINDGKANFTWHKVNNKVSNYFEDNDQEDGPYGVQTTEILDVNSDGNLDLILGGSYKDESYDYNLTSPTILWGDGSGIFDYNNKLEIWKFGEKPYYNGIKVGNNDDFSFADIDQDGFIDAVIQYIYQIDNDPNNNGNTTMYYQYQVMKNNSNQSFTDVTSEWLPDSIKNCTVVWTILKDIDNNGKLDLTEYASTTYKVGDPNGNCSEKAWRWEWNGSKFDKIN
ncbi:MAG: VCBS repeat-containing protein [Flavobacteriaceae bacterium]|nr:VCBS repeat-containing protein [Flavobacteriaceae bacterium]MBT5772659.1 VCBS repeat-containing protein [Flavobacteriaceae bacterium]